MAQEVTCQYCGDIAEFVDSSYVYGKSYGMMYLCRPCNAYVGVHKGSDKPLGCLANAELREWKKRAHAMFDPIWKSRKMSRGAAYQWLAQQMGKTPSETHIGMFSVSECKRVIECCSGYK